MGHTIIGVRRIHLSCDSAYAQTGVRFPKSAVFGRAICSFKKGTENLNEAAVFGKKNAACRLYRSVYRGL